MAAKNSRANSQLSRNFCCDNRDLAAVYRIEGKERTGVLPTVVHTLQCIVVR